MEHYYTKSPSGERRDIEIEARCLGRDYRFISSSGVFSKRHIDTGTLLLIETVAREEAGASGMLLDLGCGYGPAGIILAKTLPALQVLMSDINERAVELARGNARSNGATDAKAVQSDGFEAVNGYFDIIITNPPMRTGKQNVTALMEASFAHLKPGGRFYAVIAKKQGAPSYAAILEGIFGACATADRGSGFSVFKAVRRT